MERPSDLASSADRYYCYDSNGKYVSLQLLEHILNGLILEGVFPVNLDIIVWLTNESHWAKL